MYSFFSLNSINILYKQLLLIISVSLCLNVLTLIPSILLNHYGLADFILLSWSGISKEANKLS